MLRRLGITGTIARALRAALAFVLALGTVVIAGAQVGSGVGGVPVTLRIRSLGVNTSPPSIGGITGTGAITSQLAGDGATVGGLESNAAIPQLNFHETDAAANNGHWLCGVNGEQFRCRTSVDDGSAVGTWLLVDRTAQTVDTLALSATAITLNGVASSDFSRLSQDNVFTQSDAGAATIANNNTNAGTGAYSQITAGNNAPRSAYMLRTSTTYASPVLTNGPSGEQAVFGSGGSFPLLIGTNDTKRIQVAGDGSLIELDATAVDVNGVVFTPSTTTATGTLTGCTTSPTTTVRFVRMGNLVVGSIDSTTCTSNSGSFSLTGAVPAGMQPARTQQSCGGMATDNGASIGPVCFLFASGSTTLTITRPGLAFTASGTKGTADGATFSYIAN
jgi:hypothetical protein